MDHHHPSHHQESHFEAADSLKDVVIGMSDGLTVPFALAAGLSGAVDNTTLIVTAGIAEIAAGSIAMGLGGYLAGNSEVDHYNSEEQREYEEIKTKTHAEIQEVKDIFKEYGLNDHQIEPIIENFKNNEKAWVDFMMRYELGLEKPDPKRALKSAITIGGSYVAGGLIPLCPYMIFTSSHEALLYSILFTLVALSIFGYLKGKFMGYKPLRSTYQTVLIGGLAAGVAFLIAKFFT